LRITYLSERIATGFGHDADGNVVRPGLYPDKLEKIDRKQYRDELEKIDRKQNRMGGRTRDKDEPIYRRGRRAIDI
jgi:hypothetical protein